MDHVDARQDRRAPSVTPVARPALERGPEEELLELQRTAGNRAVVEALATVQRHHLDPETMDEQQQSG
ncbi:MAG TPA: hypothetical protein VGM28_07360 [Candidatus Limnocylindrales bacterium]|jgi:hypothetical protein